MESPAARVVRDWFDAFRANDMAAARRLFRDDSTLHVGRPMREYRGLDGLLQWYQQRHAAAGEGFSYEVEEFLYGGNRVAALITLHAGGKRSTQVAIYEIADDHITDIWIYEDDPIEDRRGLELSRELQAAVLAGDADTLQALVANEFVLTGSATLGALTKSQWIDAALNAFTWERFDFGAATGYSLGDVDVALFFLDQRGRHGESDASGSFFAVDVWKHGHRSQLVSRFATRTTEA